MTKKVFPIQFGAGVQLYRFTIPYTDLTGIGSTTGSVDLMELSGKDAVLGVRAQHTASFSGGSITACTVSVGGTVEGATGFTSAFDVYQSPGATTLQNTAMFKNGSSDGQTVQANFTATGANLSDLTSGSVDIDLAVMRIGAKDLS